MPSLSSCRFSVYATSVALLITFALSIFARTQTSLNLELARIQHLMASSKRLQTILKQAKGKNQNRISFDVISTNANVPYQAYTTPLEGDDKKGVTVHVTSGLSNQVTEMLVAHELFHVVLQNQGWPTQVNSSVSQKVNTTLPGAIAFQEVITRDATTALMSCYPDALLDRWMLQRGYAPKQINRRQYEITVGAAKTTERPPPPVFSLWQKYVALINYCLLIRERDFKMKDVFSAYANVDPEMAHDQELLEKQLGTRLRCTDVPSCLEATKKLRHAAGFDGQGSFLNPLTNKWE
jgi:hypothetical protein